MDAMMELKTKPEAKKIGFVIKKDGYQMPFAEYKLRYILEQVDLQAQSSALITLLISHLASVHPVTTAAIYQELLNVLIQEGYEKQAQQIQQKHEQQEKQWLEQTNPEKRLSRLQSKDPALVH